MSSYYRAFYFATATIISLVATTATAQEEAENPFSTPPDAEASNPFSAKGEGPTEKRPTDRAAILRRAMSNTPVFWADEQTQHSARLQQALREPLNNLGFEFTETPLIEIVNFIRDEYNIEVQLDIAALNDLGFTTEEHITANLRNISLGAALRLMLRQLELTYIISDEVLLITTEEEALTRMHVAVYPVGDLLAVKQGYEDDGDEPRTPEDMEALMDVIISTVASDTWVANGGPEAEITAMQPGLLVISQTQDVHEQISRLLSALRRAKEHPSSQPHVKSKGENVDQGGGGMF